MNNDEINEKLCALWLNRMPGIGAALAHALLKHYGSFTAVHEADIRELRQTGILGEGQLTIWERCDPSLDKVGTELKEMEESGIRCVVRTDPDYPKRLTTIANPPITLYVKGRLPDDDRPSAAIVGARGCSAYGRQEADFFGGFLAGYGVQVISGMAYGIDAAGHKGALEGGGDTYAVLGCGVNICYPPSNYRLFDEIQKNGGIISTYPPGTAPRGPHFPARNRIISGLSDLVIIIEAKRKSGSLITADFALEQGREIFALPGRRTEPLCEGCNRLIRVGAGIITCPEDVLDALHISHGLENGEDAHPAAVTAPALVKSEKMVYSAIDLHLRSLEEIISRTGLSSAACLQALIHLEMMGLIAQPDNQYYIRTLRRV